MFSLSSYHLKVRPLAISRAGNAIEKSLFRLASPPHPKLLYPEYNLCRCSGGCCHRGKLRTWRAVTLIQSSLQFSRPKKSKQHETLSLSKGREHNFTFKAICQTAGFRRKIYQGRVCFLPFIWLGLSILFFSSTCINMPPWDCIASYTDEQKKGGEKTKRVTSAQVEPQLG